MPRTIFVFTISASLVKLLIQCMILNLGLQMSLTHFSKHKPIISKLNNLPLCFNDSLVFSCILLYSLVFSNVYSFVLNLT